MDIQRLRIFIAVARTGSLSRAGEQVHLSQPAVSLQIKQLQTELGMTLFEREPQGMRLSADGVAMLPWAERVVAAMAAFTQHAQRLHTELRGQLAIGTILDPEFTRLGAFLKVLVSRAPKVQTVMRHGISGQVRTLLSNGELDVAYFLGDPNAIDGSAKEPRWHCETLSRFRYRVLAPAGWGPRVIGQDWAGLARLPWIITPPESAHHRLLNSITQPLGLQLERAALVDQESSMVDLVRSGVGLSLARESIAIHEAQASGLVIADAVSLDCELSFIYLKSRADEPAIQAAHAALRDVWQP
mgnify:FL=1